MASNIGSSDPLLETRLPVRISLPSWTAQAWASIAITTLFVALTCWWLTQDSSIPIFDAGDHLDFAYAVHRELSSGHLLQALTLSIPYPPLAYLVGALGFAVGGSGVTQPILAENLVFVPLLALGCYQVGRLAYGASAGLLALIFALGSPLIVAQFHVFMTDAPETAMVAVSVWAIIATEGFSRIGICALAGLAVGLGMLTKEPVAFFVAGVVLVTAVRGGWRAWPGMLVFAVVALAVALPWYVHELTAVHGLWTGAVHAANQPEAGSDIAPARLSIDNFEWYFWNFINHQLYLPLFLFVVIGWVWILVSWIRLRPVSRFAAELMLGSFVAWLCITETFVHDTRYSMPMLVYLAVIGSGWIVQLPRPGRLAAASVLVLVAAANLFGTSLGTGGTLQVSLPGASRSSLQAPGLLTIYTDQGFLVAGPHRDGDLLATMRELRRAGIRSVISDTPSETELDFSFEGFIAIAQVAGLTPTLTSSSSWRQAAFAHDPIEHGDPPPCIKLDDGTGVWIRLGNPNARNAQDYCPSRHPQFYGA